MRSALLCQALHHIAEATDTELACLFNLLSGCRCVQVVARNIEMVANLGGTVSDMVQQQPGAAGQGQGYALAGAAAGSDGSGVVQHKQPRQQHQSAAGLKQRGVGQQAQQQDGLQMTQLRREVEAQSEGKDA